MKTQVQQPKAEQIVQPKAEKQASVASILSGYNGTVQKQSVEEAGPLQKKENRTGLPDDLKSGIENLSDHSMDDVKVHYNSAKPAQLQAHAYAQGNNIHLGPGQEKHLPHEAWHVVQQKQGRVKPTVQLKGVNVNDDSVLEKEADVMGEQALQLQSDPKIVQLRRTAPAISANSTITAGPADIPNRDTVAPGPIHIDLYNVLINNLAASKADAIAAIRSEYTSIGRGFAPEPAIRGIFLYGDGLRRRCNAYGPTAALVYDVLLANGRIVPHAAAALATVQNKQSHLSTINPHPATVPANLELLRNNGGIRYHDPVQVDIEANYGGANPLITSISFTEGQKGYVTKVRDTGTDASIADRPNYAGEFPRAHEDSRMHQQMGRLQSNGIVDISNVHHTATNEDAATQIARVGNRNSRVHLEAGIDAITKVIAEGGRFNCVRALGTNIRNDTYFFAASGAGFRVVEFRELWKMWQSHFRGDYGITDATVRAAITAGNLPGGGVVQQPAAPAVTGYNYDLDNSAIS